MLILASVNDKLRLVTGSAGSVFVHASWMDNISGAVAPGRTNTPDITTATTTDIVSSPGAGIFRAVKTMHIHNAGTAMQTVTVLHTDGTTTVELHRQVLGPKETLQYIDEIGFKYVNSVGEDASGSRVLIANIVPPVGSNSLIVGPEVWLNSNYDAIEMTFLVGVTGGIDDAPGFRMSVDGGVTYLSTHLGSPGYGVALHYGGGSSQFAGTSFALPYGYLGTPAYTGALQFPSTGRVVMYQFWKAGQLKTWLGQSGGYAFNQGGYVYNFWGWTGGAGPPWDSPVTHMKFYWVNGGTFKNLGYWKLYGMK